jgi:8-oxo-dGTP diphosphatase
MTTVVVTAAVIERDGRFLLTRRPQGVHLEGHWEFPGGKCEPHETYETCLVRELREELAAEAVVGKELLSSSHTYPDRRVELHFFYAKLLTDPVPQLGQDMSWVRREDLPLLKFPPADDELVALLTADER